MAKMYGNISCTLFFDVNIHIQLQKIEAIYTNVINSIKKRLSLPKNFFCIYLLIHHIILQIALSLILGSMHRGKAVLHTNSVVSLHMAAHTR